MEHHLQTMTLDQALDESSKIFDRVAVGRSGKRPIKEVGKAFKLELERLGLKHKGRPAGSGTGFSRGTKNKRTNRKIPVGDGIPANFDDAFGHIEITQELRDQANRARAEARAVEAARRARIRQHTGDFQVDGCPVFRGPGNGDMVPYNLGDTCDVSRQHRIDYFNRHCG